MFRRRNTEAKNEAAFWNWFIERSNEYFSFEQNQESLFDELRRALAKVNSDLCFEFGPVENGKREFVISAGGIQASFPAVTRLYQAAPALSHWKLIAFRPRRDVEMEIEFGNKRIGTNDVWFQTEPDKKRVGLVLYTDKFAADEDNAAMQILYLMLDSALGEYDVETKVGFIECETLPANFKQFGLRPFRELPQAVDQLFADMN